MAKKKSTKRNRKLPGGLGRLVLPKPGQVAKMKQKYPDEQYATSEVSAEGRVIGYLVRKKN